jgi:hypothetical protein
VKIAVFLGKKQLVERSQAVSDDRGEYRFTGLEPGKYLVGITGRPWYSAQLDADKSLSLGHECFAPTFYPNVTVPSAANPIGLHGGDEFVANMVATIVPAATIRLSTGGVTGNATGMERGRLTLRPANTERSPWFSDNQNWEASALMTVPYGDYDLEASGVGTDGKPVFTSIQVRANAPEVELELHPKPGAIVRGTLTSPVETSFVQLKPLLFLQDMEHQQVSWASLSKAGPFTFQPTAPGTYRLNLLNAADFYIDRVQIDGQEQPDDRVNINADHVPTLRVHISEGAGKVEGVVRKNGMPVVGALVVLIRKSGTASVMPSLAFQTDSDGSFTFAGLHPDDYVLFTSGDLELEYSNPEILRQIKSSGVRVTIAKGATVSRDLTLQ